MLNHPCLSQHMGWGFVDDDDELSLVCAGGKCSQQVELSGENINITYRPDGTHIAVGNRVGHVTFCLESRIKYCISFFFFFPNCFVQLVLEQKHKLSISYIPLKSFPLQLPSVWIGLIILYQCSNELRVQ